MADDLMAPIGWAAYCAGGCPGPYILPNVYPNRLSVMHQIGSAWDDHDWRRGWRKAKKHARFRAIKVRITPLEAPHV